MKKCPYCAESIKDEAKVCRFCNHDFLNSGKKVYARDHESYIAYTILCILLPVIGIILGIIYLAKEKKLDKKLGEHCIAFSILFGIIQYVAWNAYVVLSFHSIY